MSYLLLLSVLALGGCKEDAPAAEKPKWRIVYEKHGACLRGYQRAINKRDYEKMFTTEDGLFVDEGSETKEVDYLAWYCDRWEKP